MSKIVRVGAVQSEPVWLDLDGSVDKTISLIEKAAADGVNVLGFPEVWIPGYPWYVMILRMFCIVKILKVSRLMTDAVAG